MEQGSLAVFRLDGIFFKCPLTMIDFQSLMMKPEENPDTRCGTKESVCEESKKGELGYFIGKLAERSGRTYIFRGDKRDTVAHINVSVNARMAMRFIRDKKCYLLSETVASLVNADGARPSARVLWPL
ncbi:hypothetical protein EVAR_27257_1 [Eumeta japonica]|uniref:Uncharacterized protein n=1 Tax=Eumeta variegata TaxID=151549 RepID=A0A4C1W0B9_EUMVA|nr:hypothetical protein EVAR_27257_1 [Eumeta japonica]